MGGCGSPIQEPQLGQKECPYADGADHGTFRDRFPRVLLNADLMVVDDGDIITAGGVMAWLDLGLVLIGRYLGSTTRLETARRFLVDPARIEQRCYRRSPITSDHGDAEVLAVQRWLDARIGKPVSVEEMCAVAGMTRRTFFRRFQAATGATTQAYIQELGVARARELLAGTTRSEREVAWAVGYSDLAAFRKAFRRRTGLTPSVYRARFRVGLS